MKVLVITVMATIHGLTTGMLLFGFVALIGVIAFVAYGAFAVTSPLQSCHPEHRFLVRRILRFLSRTMRSSVKKTCQGTASEAAEKSFLDQLHFAGAKAQHILNDLRHE